MHHLVVDGGAEGAGEPVVALEAGGGALLTDVRFGDPIQLQQGHARLGRPGGDAQGVGREPPRAAQLLDFLAAFVVDLFANQGGALLRLQSNGSKNPAMGRIRAWRDS